MYLGMVRLLQQRHVLRTTPITLPAAAELVSTFYWIFSIFFLIYDQVQTYLHLTACLVAHDLQ